MIKQKLQQWLGITEPKEFELNKDLEKQVSSLISDLKFWKQQFKKQQPTKKCTKCGRPIDLWPFNYTVGYYIKGNRVTHVTCPTEATQERKDISDE